MATKPKASTKKAPASKTTRAKRAPAKVAKTTVSRPKAAPKRATTVHKRTRAASTPERPFFTFRATRETLYWLVLGIAVVLLASWVMVLTIRIQDLYNQIEINNANSMVMPASKHTEVKQ